MRTRAFTLIELLVVIAIIAVLAAILFPVFARARESGNQASAIQQTRQLGIALRQYVDDFDGKFLPSTNYGLPESNPNRMWPAGLLPYAKEKRIFIAPGSKGVYPASWAERAEMTVGYNSATAIDRDRGCKEEQEETSGCLAFTTVASFDKTDNPALIALFALTPGGPVEKRYLGYEFSPYNGVTNPENVRLSPPLVSDRDLVKEMGNLPAELLKPIYARYGSTGNDDGQTPVIFADGHVKAYSAKMISSVESGIIWRFR